MANLSPTPFLGIDLRYFFRLEEASIQYQSLLHMKIMPPCREHSGDESDISSTPIQYLTLALNELMQLQCQQAPPIMLDTHFQFPKFVG